MGRKWRIDISWAQGSLKTASKVSLNIDSIVTNYSMLLYIAAGIMPTVGEDVSNSLIFYNEVREFKSPA